MFEIIADYAWCLFYGATLSILTKGEMQAWNSWKWWAYAIPMISLVALTGKF